MKITAETADEMILKEGAASGLVIGAVFTMVGLGVAYYEHFLVSTALWIAIAFFVIGIIVLFSSSSISVDINKAKGQLTHQTKRLIGGKSKNFNVSDVLRVETRKQWRMESTSSGQNGVSMQRPVLMSQSVIVFKDGQELPLDHQKGSSSMSMGSSVLMGGSGTEVAIANKVAAFLGVPFQEIVPPNGGPGINVGGIQL